MACTMKTTLQGNSIKQIETATWLPTMF